MCMDKVIKIAVKVVNDKNVYIPLSNEKELEVLTNNKTLSYEQIQALKALGFSFDVQREL